ncbi:uncharacterized protein BKCO1_36000112 [Diplodia corticola]|uniref:Uncharacterized protein n=1 Tax=Diplodia corticola TaxID=236234 RepID=A0A1J9QXP5_9PEZI|nr:uncharacterized protein BKCO1_36000112 [Diplodia corticola]OJD32762.1 hypothetical protein BKCO1_36000112 [Diplodia corticola]
MPANSAEETASAIHTLRTNWGHDPKAWFPEDLQPQSSNPESWPQEALEQLAQLSQLSGAMGHLLALRLIQQSADSRARRARPTRQFPIIRDIKNALEEYRAAALEEFGNDQDENHVADGAQPTSAITISSPTASTSSDGSYMEAYNELVQSFWAHGSFAATAQHLSQVYYDSAVRRAYGNGGIRGSAFGHPEDGVTIMTPEIAERGPQAYNNSTGPFLTTRQAMKNIAFAQRNEDAIILLEEHFETRLADILQDPQLQAAEILKLPFDILATLWEIVKDTKINSLPAFQRMLQLKIQGNVQRGRHPTLNTATVRQLQVDVMRAMRGIKEQRAAAKRDGKKLMVELKIPSISSRRSLVGDQPGGGAQPAGPLRRALSQIPAQALSHPTLGTNPHAQAPRHPSASLPIRSTDHNEDANTGPAPSKAAKTHSSSAPLGKPTQPAGPTRSQSTSLVPAAATRHTNVVARPSANANNNTTAIAMSNATNNNNNNNTTATSTTTTTAPHGSRRPRRTSSTSSRPTQRRRLGPATHGVPGQPGGTDASSAPRTDIPQQTLPGPTPQPLFHPSGAPPQSAFYRAPAARATFTAQQQPDQRLITGGGGGSGSGGVRSREQQSRQSQQQQQPGVRLVPGVNGGWQLSVGATAPSRRHSEEQLSIGATAPRRHSEEEQRRRDEMVVQMESRIWALEMANVQQETELAREREAVGTLTGTNAGLERTVGEMQTRIRELIEENFRLARGAGRASTERLVEDLEEAIRKERERNGGAGRE